MIVLPPPRSTLFPYTTLFRSCNCTALSNLCGVTVIVVAASLLGLVHSSVRTLNQLLQCLRILGIQCNPDRGGDRSEEHTSELQSRPHLVCRLLLEKKKSETDT